MNLLGGLASMEGRPTGRNPFDTFEQAYDGLVEPGLVPKMLRSYSSLLNFPWVKLTNLTGAGGSWITRSDDATPGGSWRQGLNYVAGRSGRE